MAIDFTINGATASLAPYLQRWRQVPIGRDHNQRVVNAGNEEIDLEFDSASITYARQWLEPASAASVNVTVLDRYNVGWRDLSGVQLEIVTYPSVEAGVAGAWSMIIRGASAA